MTGLIDFIKDKLGNIIYPITKEKAVYDDNNIRLDNKLADLPKQFYCLRDGIAISEGADLNTPIYRAIGNYYCASSDTAATILNLPQIDLIQAFTMKVYYGTGIAYITQEVKFFVSGTTYVRHHNTYTNVWNSWVKRLSTSDIINNDTTGGTDKVFSAEAGKVLGQEIDTLNNKLGDMTVIGNTVANTPITIPILTYRHIHILTFTSNNQAYSGLYFVIRADSTTINLIPIKVPPNISIATSSTGIIATSSDYSIPYTLVDVTKFM